MGYIYWSDDKQTLSYKELQLSMSAFRQFVAKQVQLAQMQLEGLFLSHEDKIREIIVPRVALHELRMTLNLIGRPPPRPRSHSSPRDWLFDSIVRAPVPSRCVRLVPPAGECFLTVLSDPRQVNPLRRDYYMLSFSSCPSLTGQTRRATGLTCFFSLFLSTSIHTRRTLLPGSY
jgi:hypothetical protein